jgi:hypothetical protein
MHGTCTPQHAQHGLCCRCVPVCVPNWILRFGFGVPLEYAYAHHGVWSAATRVDNDCDGVVDEFDALPTSQLRFLGYPARQTLGQHGGCFMHARRGNYHVRLLTTIMIHDAGSETFCQVTNGGVELVTDSTHCDGKSMKRSTKTRRLSLRIAVTAVRTMQRRL